MKKIIAIVMTIALGMVCLFGCGSSTDSTSSTSSTTAAETTAQSTEESSYTYVIDTGNYQNTWTLVLKSDGSYVLTEHNGMLDVDTEHTGATYTMNGDKVECGPWDEADGIPEFCEKDGSVVWQIDGDSIEPFVDLSNASALCGTYTYVQDRGDFTITYTIVLNPDWSWSLDILHGLQNSVSSATGDTWEELSDTSFKTGARDVEESERDFFNEDGSCVWNIVGEGLVEPENADPNASGDSTGGVTPGKYTYVDETPMGVSTWELGLNGSGEGHLGITDGDEYAFETWTDNGNGTITTGALDVLPENIPGWMSEDGASTWKINEDGTCEPVEGGAEDSQTVQPGKYSYVDESSGVTITWSIGIFGNGGGMVSVKEGDGEDTSHDIVGWTDNGDGTVTTGAWTEGTDGVELPDWFEADGSCTWKLNADETCEPVNK